MENAEAATKAALDRKLQDEGWLPLEATGFIEHVGPFWTKIEGDMLLVGFWAVDKHENRRGVVQGGMLATLADRAMGMACRRVNGDKPQATIQLDMHYIDAGRIGDFLEAHCRVVRRTRQILFAEAEILSGDSLVAKAKGIWKVLGPPSTDAN